MTHEVKVTLLRGSLRMSTDNLRGWCGIPDGEAADRNFFKSTGWSDDWMVEIDPIWEGHNSLQTLDNWFSALSRTKGWAEILLEWTFDGSKQGVRVCDGVVTRHEVKIKLKGEVAP